jgi:uncharacterized membrane protein
MRRPVLTILPFLLPGTAFWTLVIIGIATGSAGVWFAAAVLGVVTFLGFLLFATSKATATRKTKKRVWADGIPATAKVIRAQASGSLNNHPYVDLTLEVTVPNQLPRTVEVNQVISQLMVGKIEPGDEIAVRVDRNDPKIVVVDEALTPYGY